MYKLGNQLTDRINFFVSPLEIVICNDPEPNTRFQIPIFYKEGLRVFPTPENVRLLSGAIPIIENPVFVTFESDNTLSPLLKRFLLRNFGGYDNTIFTEAKLQQIENIHLKLKVTDVSSLKNAIVEISKGWHRVYPIQICSTPRDYPVVKSSYEKEAFTVVIGDSWEDIAHFWNHPMTLTQLHRTGTSEIWLPTALANEPILQELLPGWFKKLARYLCEHGRPIHFVSHSLSENHLQEFAEKLAFQDKSLNAKCRSFSQPEVPNFVLGTTYLEPPRDSEIHTAVGERSTLAAKVPGTKDGAVSRGHWMEDVYIQYHSNHYLRNFWWQLPKRNYIAQHMFEGRPARVTSCRLPSALVYSGDSAQYLRHDHHLVISLPNEYYLFYSLIIGDISTERVSRRIHEVALVDKGPNLAGLLKLFSGLSQAYWVFSLKYWHEVFTELSSGKVSTNAETQAKNKIGKILGKYPTNSKDKDHYAAIILKEAKNWFGREIEPTYEHFEQIAKRLGEDVEWHNIESHISSFIEANILQVGLKSKCPRCGYNFWYPIDDVRQMNECKGCGQRFALRPKDQKWYFHLNSSVKAGIEQHLIPVVLTLGKLLEESKTSFIFSPQLDLYNEKGASEDRPSPVGDLDVVCIKDGQFIIGEVKESDSLFKESDFDNMAKFAQEIRPDELIFAAFNINRGNYFESMIGEVRSQLEKFGIQVRQIHLESRECKDV